LTQMIERLVGREPRTHRRDLEQDAARLPEVDRLEIEAGDDRGRRPAALDHALPPGFVLLGCRRPRDVVDRSGAADPALVRRVVRIERAAAITAHFEAGLGTKLETKRAFEEPSARVRLLRLHAD